MTTRILFIEDSADDVLLAAEEIRQAGLELEYRVVDTRNALVDALDDGPWSAIVSDDNLPGWSGIDALQVVRARDVDVPFILVSGTISEERAVHAMRGGANDYVLKDNLARLGPAVLRELRDAASRRERNALYSELQRSKEQYRRTFEEAPIGIANADRFGAFLNINQRLGEIFGCRPEELRGRRFSDLSHSENRSAAMEKEDSVVTGAAMKVSFDHRCVRSDGSVVWVHATISRIRETETEEGLTRIIVLIEDVTEQRAAREALDQAQRIAHVGNWEHDLLTGKRVWSDELFRIFGRLPGRAPDLEEVFNSVHPEDREMVMAQHQAMIDGERTMQLEYRQILPDGSERWLAVRAHAQRLPDGRPSKINGVVQDITDSKRSEEALRRMAVQQAAVANLGQLALIGATVDFLVQQTRAYIADFVQLEHFRLVTVEEADEQAAYAISHGIVTTEDLRREARFPPSPELLAEGYVSGLMVAVTAGPGEPWGVISAWSRTARAFSTTDADFFRSLAMVIGQAIERSRAEQALRVRTAQQNALARNLQLLLESTVEGIVATDLEGRCTLVNGAAMSILGRTSEELIGSRIHNLIAGRGSTLDFEEVLRTGGVVTMLDDTFTHSSGSDIPVEYSAAPIRDHDTVMGVVVTFSDTTRRRRLEAKLEQANRVAGLGRLAATVAHEFNNVLMGISPFIEIIRRNAAPDRVAIALEHVQRAIQRGKRVTSDILRFTQPAEPTRTSIDVATMLGALADEARSLMGNLCDVQLDVAGPGLHIDGDPNQIYQILSNLILNARDAMAHGGRLTIAARFEDSDASTIRLSISDTGSGIPADTLAHVFEPLFTTKRNGTGLGLSVVHQIVTRHDGEIYVESTPGGGTTFHVLLPAASRPATAVERIEPPRPRRSHVLLIEDDASVSTGIAALLELENMTVEIVDTGAAALESVRQRRPDVVVLDVGLPDMDGRAVYDGLAALYPGLPVIFSTGHGDRTRFEDLLTRPFARFLLKPYESSKLLAAINEIAAG